MHVLYIVGQSSGGLPHYTAQLANAVSDHAEVTVMKPVETSADDLFREDVELIEAFEPLSVSMPNIYKFDVNPFRFLREMWSYDNLRRADEIDADVVHDPTGLFPYVKFFVKRHGLDEKPFVTTRHEVPVDRFTLSRPPVFVEEVLLSLLPDVDGNIVVHTERQREVLLERGTEPERIVVIPHAAYDVFGEHEQVDTRPEPNTLLFFGNIVPPKGLDTLVEAIPIVKREIPDVTLVIAGDGRISSASKRIIRRNSENFEVHNEFVPNERVKELFARAEVVTLPYRSQEGTKGHSGVLATAYSFGKPVVASTASEFPKMVEKEGCGRVVPPNDPEKLAKVITEVLRDHEARARMSKNSLRMAEELSWDSVAERYLDLYHDLVDSEAAKATIGGEV